jgi:acetyl-CoA carboxylase alpha subunit
MAAILQEVLINELKVLVKVKPDRLVERRIDKFSKMGVVVG